MALTLPTATRNAACDAVVDLVDAGTTNASGQIVFRTSGDVEVATLPMSNPAFGNAGASVAGRADASAITDDSSATGGTTTKFTLEDRDETEIFEGSVGTSGEDINLTSTVIGAGDTVSMGTSFTVTMPAS